MDFLAPWKTKNDSNSQHRLKIPKILLDTNEVIDFGLFVPLASPPTPASSCYPPPCVDWRNGRMERGAGRSEMGSSAIGEGWKTQVEEKSKL